jgi:hypothetical protein
MSSSLNTIPNDRRAVRNFTKPAAACQNCWRAWLTGPRNSIGYCWHRKIAWRAKSGAEFAVVVGVTREEHRAMLEYVNEMESVLSPAKHRDSVAGVPPT